MFCKNDKSLAAFDNNMNAATGKKIKIAEKSIGGILEIIRYHKDSFLIGILDNDVSVKGNMVFPQVGIEYYFVGKWVNHPKYGESFSFIEYKASYPKDLSAIRSYLMENCKWIGKEISKKIVNKFGEETLDICKNEPERVVKEIPGITLKRVQEITAMLKINEKSEHVQLELKKILSRVRISKRAISKITEIYKHESPEKIRENPYRLIDDIDGVGFLTADMVATKVGFKKTGEPRIRAGIIHVLKEGARNGNTGLPLSELVLRACKILGLTNEIIIYSIKELIGKRVLAGRKIADKPGIHDLYCMRSLYEKEKSITAKLQELLNCDSSKLFNKPLLEGLASDQAEAMQKAVKSKAFILTGAPGTGKTYLLKRIIESFPISTKVVLAAPTGKAARRMTEQSGFEAATMHKILKPEMYCEPGKKPEFRFTHNSLNPINADLIILDESSMIGVSLMASFFDAVLPETVLIMIGDTYQLPSVGPGNVLKDMISSGLIPTTELTIIKRQDEGLIIQNCHKIKNGGNIEVNNKESKDFFFLKKSDEASIKKTIIELISKRLPEAYKADPLKDIQIISPLREKTGLSCKWLNKACQKILNKNPSIDKIPFKIGDKVIQTKNDYELGVINGDIGFIHSINLGDKNYYIDFQNVEGMTEIPLYGNDLQLAYALTCHKFQGSESRIIIIPIHKSFGPLIMQRNWLYTAISRAKEVCILVGQREEIPKIIRRNKQQKRFTNLEQFLKERKISDNARNRRKEEGIYGTITTRTKGSDDGRNSGIAREHVNPDIPAKRNHEFENNTKTKKANSIQLKDKEKYNLLEQAILALAGDCDGAVADDGKGFNAYDTEFGHMLADVIQARKCRDSPLGRLSFDEYERAFHMVRKYRGQLMNAGIDYERIMPKPVRRKKN